ncbi:MAG TPA: HAD-IA family hydrolase [Gammaproteobacteria bacterium]|nr:HAD-IA family hydrolase [Gammaproteobacteria bacterium]
MRRSVKLLVFDWDGTLIDSIGHIVATMQAAIRDAGLPQRSEREIRDIIGLGLREATARLFPALDGPELRQALGSAYRRRYYAGDDEGALLPGVGPALERLAACGYVLALATGKSRQGLDRVLARTGLGHRFRVTRCADEGRSKPYPEMLEHILRVTDTPAGEALVVGDSEHDLCMARNAGVEAIGVCSGAHDESVLWRCAPLACLPGVADLPAWLESTGRTPPAAG